MRVTVCFYSYFKDLTGCAQTTATLPDGSTLEALFRKDSDFLRTPKKGQGAKTSYRPLKDITWIVELFFGMYCMAGLWFFLGFTNVIVSPFLLLYASGFLFVGMLSIIHYKRPELISFKLGRARPVPAPAVAVAE